MDSLFALIESLSDAPVAAVEVLFHFVDQVYVLLFKVDDGLPEFGDVGYYLVGVGYLLFRLFLIHYLLRFDNVRLLPPQHLKLQGELPLLI